jgi:hypothetical protein
MPHSILRLAGRTACLFLAVSLLASCSDDSDGDGPRRVVVPLEGAISDQVVFAGQSNQYVFTLQLPPEYRNVTAVTLDAEGSARHIQAQPLPGALLNSWKDALRLLGGHGATATIRVGNDPETVCTQGVLYGPFDVTHTTSAQVTPETVEADAPTLQIINAGMIAMCVTINPSIDATFSVDSVEVQVTDVPCGSPANFAGRWVGTYSCGNSCGSAFGGEIEIIVSQNGAIASYSDDETTFTGTVCGNRFRFERVTAGEIERGTLTLDGPDQATKRSTWRGTSYPWCQGNCVDVLTRIPN